MSIPRLVDNQEIKAIYDAAMLQRVRHGLPMQELDEAYCRLAQNWANHMAATGFMRHGGGEEIVAWSSDPRELAAECIRMWMGSTGHRRWVLSGSRLCGYAVARSKSGTYWAGEFTAGVDTPEPVPGPPAPPTPTPIPPKKPTPFLDWLRRWLGF